MRKLILVGMVGASFVATGCVTHEKEVVERPAPVVVSPAPAPQRWRLSFRRIDRFQTLLSWFEVLAAVPNRASAGSGVAWASA
jgi:hypothetical protein